MKNIYRLLEWLNHNNVRFDLQDLNDDEGNFLIQTDRYEIETNTYCHEFEITEEREDYGDHPDIDQFV